MTDPHDDELRRVMRDERAPWGYAFRTGGQRPANVSDLVAFAKSTLGDHGDVEARLDRYVRRIGGSRETPINLDHLPRRLVRRLAGRATPPVDDVYFVPRAFFDADT